VQIDAEHVVPGLEIFEVDFRVLLIRGSSDGDGVKLLIVISLHEVLDIHLLVVLDAHVKRVFLLDLLGLPVGGLGAFGVVDDFSEIDGLGVNGFRWHDSLDGCFSWRSAPILHGAN